MKQPKSNAMRKLLAEIRLHPFARDMIRGGTQFTAVWYIFAAITYRIAPLTPDYFHTMRYCTAALEIAPVTMAVGLVAGLLCDLVLRKAS